MNEGMHMMGRICRIPAVLLCIGLLTCTMTGCFGSTDEATNTTSSTAVSSSDTTASTLTASTAEVSTLIDGKPSEYVNSLGNRPIVVLFYAPGGVDDEKVLSALRDLRANFSAYTVLMYDYRLPSAYGDLSQELQIDYMPQIVLIDHHGEKRTVWNGYVDKATLNQSLITLGTY
jgi:hypothetical protein